MNKIKYLLSSSLLVLPALSVVSCGRVENSTEKTKQDDDFKSDEIKSIAESIWTEKVLLDLYSEGNNEIKKLSDYLDNKESKFYKEALLAFDIYASNNLSKDANFFVKMYSEWNKKGWLTAEEQKVLAPFNIPTVKPGAEVFELIYKNGKTEINKTINNSLLTLKYFSINNEEELKKLDSNFETNKAKYDLNYYNLISYIIDSKPYQVWEYEETNTSNIFVTRNKILNTTNDFKELLADKYDLNYRVSENEMLLPNRKYLTEFGGYKGIVVNNASKYNLDYTFSKLIAKNKDAVVDGFYSNNADKKIISVNNEGKLNTSISLYDEESKKLKAAYVVQIIPTVKEIEKVEDDKTKVEKILSFDGSIFKDKLTELMIMLSFSDTSITTKAISSFKKIGYRLEPIYEILKETLKGSDFI